MDTIPIGTRFSQIRRSLLLLRSIQRFSLDQFVGRADLINIAERQLQVAIQAAIDAGQHVLSELGAEPPSDYADVFTRLGQVGVVAPDLVPRLVKMARLRNVLVHMYLDVDLVLLHRIVQQDLGDLEAFVTQVARFLNQSGEDL